MGGTAWYGGSTAYQVYDIASGALVSSTPVGVPINSNGYGDPFGLYDAGSGTFYVGTYSGSGSGLYSYDRNTSTWHDHGVFNSLFAGAVHNGQVYASGLNAIWNGGTGQDNQIALYDLTGGNSHDVLIHATGNSAGVAVDRHGNVYYANYNGGNTALYMWTAAQIDSVSASFGNGDTGGGEGDLYLTYDDGTLLTLLPAGANGLNVDEGGNVFVTVNDFGGTQGLLMWNETLGFGEDDNYRFIVTNADGSYGWFNHVEVEGDFLNGGTLWVSSGSGLAEITYLGLIPEPASAGALTGLLALGGTLLRRRPRV